MASPAGSPGGSPVGSPVGGRRSHSPPPPAGSPLGASPNAATPRAGLPASSPVRGSPGASVQSNSPVFARTPGSAGLYRGSPDASPATSPALRMTPGMSPSPGASPSPGGRSPVSGPRRARHRGFLSSAPGMSPQMSPMRHTPKSQMGGSVLEERRLLYGTNIDEQRIRDVFRKFIENFVDDSREGVPAGKAFYVHQLERLGEDFASIQNDGMKFPMSGKDIYSYSKELYTHLINFPTEVVPIMDHQLWTIAVLILRADPEEFPTVQAQIHSLHDNEKKIMRLMNPTIDIERLVSVSGIVIRCSDLVPDMQTGLFQCTECKNEVQVQLSHWTIDEPTRCESCGKSQTYTIIHNDCQFSNRQIVKLQETPEGVPEGETPQSIVVYVYDHLVDQVRPGDRVEVTGIYRASAVRPMRNWSKCSAVFRTHVDAISIYSEDKGRIDAPTETRELQPDAGPILPSNPDLDPEKNTEEEIVWNQRVRELSVEKDGEGNLTIVEKLVASFAPSIYDEDDVKKGLLCQLFGGTAKAKSTTKGKTRPEINTLLCGDPSTAKSQLMLYANKLAPRAVITSGKGSSAVGLTASINRDPITKELVLESGALVLADRGMCCIDEFDKMDENARAILHEAMEQQTVSVAKAGIIASLNARASILASANPTDSAYDPKKSVVENINLPKNLMTRFDLIWLMLDKRQRDLDRQLANHLVSMYSVSGAAKRPKPPLDAETFRRYVSYARFWVLPRITKQAGDKLIEEYTNLRNQGSSRDTITATTRILESLIRLSESLAKMELREEVLVRDVDEAVRLLKRATYAAAIDPETGLIDMEQLVSGMGAARRNRQREVESLLEEVLTEKGGAGQAVSLDELRALMNERLGSKKEYTMKEGEFNQAVQRLEEEGRCRRKGASLQLRSAA